MKNLVLPALLFGAASMAACTSDPESGDILVTWSLVSDTTPVACPAGAIAVVHDGVFSEPTDCVAGEMLLLEDPGSYNVFVEITEADGTLRAESFSQVVVVAEGGAHDADFEIQLDHGFLDLDWTLTGEDTDTALTCEDVIEQDGVSILATPTGGGGTALDTLLDCVDYGGLTRPLPLGLYTTAIALIDTNGAALGPSTTVTDSNILIGNEVIGLGTVDILVSGY